MSYPEELIDRVSRAIFASMAEHRGPEGFESDYWYLHQGYKDVAQACRDDAVAALDACYAYVQQDHQPRERIECTSQNC